jgi:hypothetical protein
MPVHARAKKALEYLGGVAADKNPRENVKERQ